MEANAHPPINPARPGLDASELSRLIKREALKLGFDACGIAPAHPLPTEMRERFQHWLNRGYQGDMHYMERNLDLRMDPTRLVPDAASVIVVALNYATDQPTSNPGVARYARRPDYHPLIRQRLLSLLKQLKDFGLEVTGRAFSDSAPLAERYWAEQAGIGWVGKNQLLIVPVKGSWFLLGALVITLPLQYDKPVANRCGTCNRCIEACPSQALLKEGCLEATRCLSYLTIEKKGSFTSGQKRLLEGTNSFFGCDRCQEVCPWNRFSSEATDSSFPLLPIMDTLDSTLEHMDPETFKQSLCGSSLERTGMEALLRNLEVIKKVRPSE